MTSSTLVTCSSINTFFTLTFSWSDVAIISCRPLCVAIAPGDRLEMLEKIWLTSEGICKKMDYEQPECAKIYTTIPFTLYKWLYVWFLCLLINVLSPFSVSFLFKFKRDLKILHFMGNFFCKGLLIKWFLYKKTKILSPLAASARRNIPVPWGTSITSITDDIATTFTFTLGIARYGFTRLVSRWYHGSVGETVTAWK